jgi:hypothetical protein
MLGDKIREILNNPAAPGLEYIADPKSYEGEVLNGYSMEVVKYGFQLDEFCPAKMGQLTCIIGHTTVGKTTLILWLLTMLAKQGKKILIYSAENRISTLYTQAARFYGGQVSIEVLERMRPYFRFIKHERTFSYRELLNQATYLLDAGFEFDFFFIDPYNSLRIDNKGMNSHEYHLQAVEEMRVLTMTTQKSIFLNCHTVTEAQREKPDVNGHTPVPIMAQVEGGGKFPNKADDVMILHRQIHSNIEGEKYITEIHVGKVRNSEFGGTQTPWGSPLRCKFLWDRTGFEVIGSPTPMNHKQIEF